MAFQEDVRQFFFTSLTEVKSASGKKLEKHRLLATPEMVSAAKDFVNALDLMTAEDGEYVFRYLEGGMVITVNGDT